MVYRAVYCVLSSEQKRNNNFDVVGCVLLLFIVLSGREARGSGGPVGGRGRNS